MKRIALVCFLCVTACGQRPQANPKKSVSEKYSDAQEQIINKHRDELAKMGRIPIDYGSAYILLGQYGWHSGNVEAVGNQPPLWLLQEGSRQGGGSFGAYTFYPPAFEQAKRTWIVDAFMLPGTDLLWIRNSNIKFDKTVIGRTVEFLFESGCYQDDGNTPCEPQWANKLRSIKDAKVIDVFGHTYEWWGSGGHGPEYWRGPLRLDKIAPAFMEQWGVMLKPADWVDMCACTISSSSTDTKPDKPCAQGGTLMPGETCSVSVLIGR